MLSTSANDLLQDGFVLLTVWVVASPFKLSHEGRISGCQVTTALLLCYLLHVLIFMLKYGLFFFFLTGFGREAGRSSLSGCLVTLWCKISANEETGSWLGPRRTGPKLQAFIIKEESVYSHGVSKSKILFCRPALYVGIVSTWSHLTLYPFKDKDVHRTQLHPAYCHTNQSQLLRLHLLASEQGWGAEGALTSSTKANR